MSALPYPLFLASVLHKAQVGFATALYSIASFVLAPRPET